MPRHLGLISCCIWLVLLASCGLLTADATPAIDQRAQQLCDAAIKAGKLQNCQAIPFNVDSAAIKLTDAAKQHGAIQAWCAQYDYAQFDKTNLWSTAHDEVLITQSQDLSYSFAPITTMPAAGCGGYQMP